MNFSSFSLPCPHRFFLFSITSCILALFPPHFESLLIPCLLVFVWWNNLCPDLYWARNGGFYYQYFCYSGWGSTIRICILDRFLLILVRGESSQRGQPTLERMRVERRKFGRGQSWRVRTSLACGCVWQARAFMLCVLQSKVEAGYIFGSERIIHKFQHPPLLTLWKSHLNCVHLMITGH